MGHWLRRWGVGDSNPIGRNSRRSATGDGGALRGVHTGCGGGSGLLDRLRSASSALVRISVERLWGDQTPGRKWGRESRNIQLICCVNRGCGDDGLRVVIVAVKVCASAAADDDRSDDEDDHWIVD